MDEAGVGRNTKGPAMFGSIGTWEMVMIAGLALLLFGKRLPDVGRSLGKGIVEFKKGLAGVEDEVAQVGVDAAEHRKQLHA